jgi:hypothetical protein
MSPKFARSFHCEAEAEQAISPLHTRWTVRDLLAGSCSGTFLNLTLWGIPATVMCVNTLKAECLWAWQNAFWHAVRSWPTKAKTEEEDVRFGQGVTAMRGFLVGVAS